MDGAGSGRSSARAARSRASSRFLEVVVSEGFDVALAPSVCENDAFPRGGAPDGAQGNAELHDFFGEARGVRLANGEEQLVVVAAADRELDRVEVLRGGERQQRRRNREALLLESQPDA